MKNNKPLASFNPEFIKPYLHGAHDTALEYIEALEKEVEQLRKGIATEKRRADAAVEDLTRMANCYKDCGGCVYIGYSIGKCEYDRAGNCYEWRGPQAGEGERDG